MVLHSTLLSNLLRIIVAQLVTPLANSTTAIKTNTILLSTLLRVSPPHSNSSQINFNSQVLNLTPMSIIKIDLINKLESVAHRPIKYKRIRSIYRGKLYRGGCSIRIKSHMLLKMLLWGLIQTQMRMNLGYRTDSFSTKILRRSRVVSWGTF